MNKRFRLLAVALVILTTAFTITACKGVVKNTISVLTLCLLTVKRKS